MAPGDIGTVVHGAPGLNPAAADLGPALAFWHTELLGRVEGEKRIDAFRLVLAEFLADEDKPDLNLSGFEHVLLLARGQGASPLAGRVVATLGPYVIPPPPRRSAVGAALWRAY